AGDQLPLQLQVILDDAVVDDDDFALAVAMGMGVLLGGPAMGGPARVADAVAAFERLLADALFQVAQLALGAPHFEAQGGGAAVLHNGNAGRVVAAVLEALQAIEDDRDHALIADVADDAAHSLGLTPPSGSSTPRSRGWSALRGRRVRSLRDRRLAPAAPRRACLGAAPRCRHTPISLARLGSPCLGDRAPSS